MNSKNPKISVIMAAYNAEKYIEESIESILSQSFKDFELIIIDDCSSDSTSKIIESFQTKDKRIIFLKNKINLHVSETRNRGIKISRGKYVAIQDADDISMPMRLEKQFSFLENNKNIFLLGSGAKIIDELGNEKGNFVPICDLAKITQKLKKKNILYHPTIFFRNNGILYRTKFYHGEDYDLYLRIISSGGVIGNIPETLIRYRVHSYSLTRMQGGISALFAALARKFYFERIKNIVDTYDNFNVESITLIEKKSNDKIYLIGELEASLKIENFKEVRLLAIRYFKYQGFSFYVFTFLLVSIGGINFYHLLRKIRDYLFH